MPRLSARPPVDRKFVALHDDVHQRVMRLAKKTHSTANDVIFALLEAVDQQELERHLIKEKEKRDAARVKLKEQQSRILGRLSKLSSEELDRLLETL